MNPFADRVRQLRVERRMRQKELARLLNLDASSICQLEAGRRGPFSEKQLNRLVKVFELTADEAEDLLIDAWISNPIRRVPTCIGREKLLVLDALIEKLDVLTEDQIALIKRILEMKIDRSLRSQVSDNINEQRRSNM